MSKVVIRKATYESLTPIIREIFEIFPLDLQGKKVFINGRGSEITGLMSRPSTG